MKWILGFLILASVVCATLYFDGCFHKKAKAPDVQYIDPLADTVRHYKDLYQTEHAQVQIEINSHAAENAMHRQLVDSIIKADGIKYKQLQSYSKMTMHAGGGFTVPLIPLGGNTAQVSGEDSDNSYTIAPNGLPDIREFTWGDGFMHVTGIVFPDSVNITWSLDESFTTTSYWKRKHHFLGIGWGKKIYYFDATCNNPNVSITGLKAIKIN